MQSVYLMLAQPEHIQFTDLGMAIIYCFSFFFSCCVLLLLISFLWPSQIKQMYFVSNALQRINVLGGNFSILFTDHLRGQKNIAE